MNIVALANLVILLVAKKVQTLIWNILKLFINIAMEFMLGLMTMELGCINAQQKVLSIILLFTVLMNEIFIFNLILY